ncbi:MAG: hypothetical protein ACFB8W_17280 [Elainellaceae cyanobacterium]
MRHFCDEWIQEWCYNNGWTDPVMNPINHYWAFPPGAVMPQPIPTDALRMIKVEKGLSRCEKRWILTAGVVGSVMVGLSYWLSNPMPLVAAFALMAFIVAGTDVDEL